MTEEKISLKKGYSSPRWSGEYPDCSMPMTFDTYSNCAFGCAYCFSQYQRGIGGSKESYFAKEVDCVNVEKIKRMFLEPDSSQFGEYIKARKTMQWGGLSDQFDWFEKKFGVTLELLRFFREIDYPICFSTKGTWWLDDPRYTELFKGNRNWKCRNRHTTQKRCKFGRNPLFLAWKSRKEGGCVDCQCSFFEIFDRMSYIFSRFYAIMRR